LLSHRSGIPNYTENTDYLARLMTKKYLPDQLVHQFCSDTLDFAPGTSFHYSNSGYVVLADVLEKVLKKNFADILSEKIFIQLNMKHSYFISGGQADNRAIGYVNDLPEKYYPVENVVGAGGITSMPEDLAIWSNALLQNKLLPPDQMNELFKPRAEWNDWDAEYGYGWMTDKDLFQVSKKHSVHYHPGTEFGFYSMLVLQPDKNLTLILLNNKGEFPRFDITDLILTFINQ
jgi:CubicO group peptidase (beta-lactamase class C family)